MGFSENKCAVWMSEPDGEVFHTDTLLSLVLSMSVFIRGKINQYLVRKEGLPAV
jgi:hypothetical protein